MGDISTVIGSDAVKTAHAANSPTGSAYRTELGRFHAKQMVCLAHRSNHVQLRAGLFAEYLQHAHHPKKEVSRSNNNAHITSRDYGRQTRHLP